MTFGEKFKAWRNSKKVSGWRIEKLTGVSRSNLSSIESNRWPPSDNVLKQLASVPELEITYQTLVGWLALSKLGPEAIEAAHKEVLYENLVNIGSPQGFFRFPCLGTVSAGSLQMVDQRQDLIYYEFSDIKEYDQKMFCLEIRGDSMSPKFEDAGVLLVRETKNYRNNGLYVIITNHGESTFKLLRFEENGPPKLVPINPNYEPILLQNMHIEKAYEVIEYKKSYI